MWRFILGVLAVFVVLMAYLLYSIVDGVTNAVDSIGSEGESLSTTLQTHLGAERPDMVALLEDGEWSLITDTGGAQDKRFSYWKDGFFRVMTGRGACQKSTDRVAIEPFVAGVLKKPIYTCKQGGTSIKALLALALPAQENWLPDLPIAEWQEQSARVDLDPALFEANTARPRYGYDYACSYEYPYIWQADDDEGAYIMTRVDDALDAATLAALAPEDGRYILRDDNGSASSYVMHAEEGSETSAEGWAVETSTAFVKRGDSFRKIPGVSIYRPRRYLEGSQADCTAFGAIDFGDAGADRDIATLEAAWTAGVEETYGPGTALNWDDLVGITQGRADAPSQLRYDFRYFELK